MLSICYIDGLAYHVSSSATVHSDNNGNNKQGASSYILRTAYQTVMLQRLVSVVSPMHSEKPMTIDRYQIKEAGPSPYVLKLI